MKGQADFGVPTNKSVYFVGKQASLFVLSELKFKLKKAAHTGSIFNLISFF